MEYSKHSRQDNVVRPIRRSGLLRLGFCLGFIACILSAAELRANPDVYAALPEDTRVIQYGMGDLDGDLQDELAILYTSGGATNLAIFRAASGRWSLWSTDGDLLSGIDGSFPSSVELADVNGDGISEIIFYYLTKAGRGMVTRILTVDTADPKNISIDVLLEDTTAPPGYPLFGYREGVPSITFLKMPLVKGDTGYRRVYCWDGNRFDKCLEIPWK